MDNDKRLVFNTLRLIKKNNIDIRYCDLWQNGYLTLLGGLLCTFCLISISKYFIDLFFEKK